MAIVDNRYAEAFLNLAVQEDAIEEYRTELAQISGIYESQKDFAEFLLNPENTSSIKKQVLSNVLEGKVSQSTLHFLLLLLDKGRIKFLPGISDEYARLADEKKNVLHLTIMTSAPLSQGYVDKVCDKFKEIYHSARVEATIEVDPTLIGGIKVAVGDKIYDGTVKGQIVRLQSALTF